MNTLEWEDLDCEVEFDASPGVWVEFRVKERDPLYGVPPDSKVTLLSGYLKWDGCCNFKFDIQEQVMLHTCSRSDLERIGAILLRLYDTLGPMNRSWSGN